MNILKKKKWIPYSLEDKVAFAKFIFSNQNLKNIVDFLL